MKDDERLGRHPQHDVEISPGGSVVYHYDPLDLDEGPTDADPILAPAVERHVARHLGPIEDVFHDPEPGVVEIGVLRVGPSEQHPFQTLITCGMAQKPMCTPADLDGWAHTELVISLPADWPFDEEDLDDEGTGWPLRLIRDLARFPHQFDTWLGIDHTVPNGEPAEPYAGETLFSGCILELPVHLPERLFQVELADGRQVHFLNVTPLYADEVDYKLELGAEALVDRFDELELSMVLDPSRPSVVHPDLPGAVGPPRASLGRKVPWWRVHH